MPLRGLFSSYFGVWDKATEEKVAAAEQLAEQALKLADDEFKLTLNVDNIRNAVRLLQQAIDTVAEGHGLQNFKRDKVLSEYIHDLTGIQCLTLRKLYFETGQSELLDQSIDTLQQTYIYAPKRSRTLVAEASLMSKILFDRYFAHGEQAKEDVQDARKFASLALSSQPKHYSKEQDVSEGNTLHELLEDAQQLFHSPIEIIRSEYLYHRGCSFMRQFHRHSDIETLRSARLHLKIALSSLACTHKNYTNTVITVADCEVLYMQRTNDTDNLEATLAVINTLDMSCCTPEQFIDASISKSTLYRRKFEHASNIVDLDCAIESAENATKLETLNFHLQVQALTNLSHQLDQSAQFRLSLEHMDAAIDAIRRALAVCPEHHLQQRSDTYMELATALVRKYTLFGGELDLTASLQSMRQATTVSVGGNIARAVRLHNLAYALRQYFNVSGAMSLLEESIQAEREALSIISDDDPQQCAMLDALSGLLLLRLQRTHNSEDLDDAVSAAEEALAKTPEYHVRRATRVQTLCNALLRRSMRQVRSTKDINRAIELINKAVATSQYDKMGLLQYSTTLSYCLVERHRQKPSMDDMNTAIKLSREALEKNPTSHPLRHDWLYSLSSQLDERCKCQTNVELMAKDLSEATTLQEECIALLPEHHPNLAWCYGILGSLRLKRGRLVLSTETQQRKLHYISAIAAFQQGSEQKTATTLAKLENGLCAGLCYYLIEEYESACKVLSESIVMLQEISPLSLDEKDRQKRLRIFHGMSNIACICYLFSGEVDTAIEVLEAGRGIMAKTAMRQHDQLAPLRDANPELHKEYVELRQLLSLPLPVDRPRIQDLVMMRNKNQAELERLEREIHQIPGLETLNKSLTASQIRRLADRGPLVVFCVETVKSYAIVITIESMVSLNLPDLHWDDIQAKIPLVAGDDRLSLQPPSKRTMAKKKMKALLAWLWDTTVNPVLTHLQLLSNIHPKQLPRLWWVSCGLMGLMPLHAAGKGDKQPTENTYARVISSYTSSFSALAFARECQSKTSADSEPRVALVTMPRTAGRSDLATGDEEQAVRDAFSSAAAPETSKRLTELCQPTAEEVLYQVRNSQTDIFHLSCHAEPDLDDPSLTALLFGNDPEALAPEPLPIAQLRKYNIAADLSSRAPQLAYLSACCTAQQYDLKLLDENIHLAAIFQLMGYPAVIGTMWEADDKAAAYIAKAFYEELFRLRQDEKGGMRTITRQDQMVYALHEAVKSCRAAKFGRTKGADDVLLWANFVYFGA